MIASKFSQPKDPAVLASNLNRILGLPDPVPGFPQSDWYVDFGCRWCPQSNSWITVLPHRLKGLTHKISKQFEVGGAAVFVCKEETGAGVQITACI